MQRRKFRRSLNLWCFNQSLTVCLANRKTWRVFFRSGFVGNFEVVGRSTQWVDSLKSAAFASLCLPGFLHRWLKKTAKACLQLDIPFNHLCVASRCRGPASFGSVWHPSNQKESHKHRWRSWLLHSVSIDERHQKTEGLPTKVREKLWCNLCHFGQISSI